jgi:hypothetical protein
MAHFFDPLVKILINLGQYEDAFAIVTKAKGRSYYLNLAKLRNGGLITNPPSILQLRQALLQ